MKLVRFGDKGLERPGIWMEDGRILDVRASAFHIDDYNEHFFASEGIDQLRTLTHDPSSKYISSDGVRLGAPVARPSKIICVGANYAEHAAEFGADVPATPILFSKATTSINGPFDPIVLPSDAQMVDSEVELGVVIGKRVSRVSETNALDCVAGYTVVNDVTERVVQQNGGQWFRGKGFDSFCPMGPWLVTPDEINDLNNIQVWQKLNGETLQSANTRELLFSIPFLISHISSGMTLLPGDVISTGTPSGIGSARSPQVLMKMGDVVEVCVEGIGTMKSIVQ